MLSAFSISGIAPTTALTVSVAVTGSAIPPPVTVMLLVIDDSVSSGAYAVVFAL